MDIKEYKAKSLKDRTLHVKLPSGLEIDVVLPTPYQFIFDVAAGTAENETDSTKKLFKMIQLPDELKLEDLEMDDFLSLMQQITDFFTKGTKSLNGFKTTQKK